MFLGKGVLKICRKCTEEHPCRSVISIFKFAPRDECSPVNLLHIFRTRFPKNTSEGLLLYIYKPFDNLIMLAPPTINTNRIDF